MSNQIILSSGVIRFKKLTQAITLLFDHYNLQPCSDDEGCTKALISEDGTYTPYVYYVIESLIEYGQKQGIQPASELDALLDKLSALSVDHDLDNAQIGMLLAVTMYLGAIDDMATIYLLQRYNEVLSADELVFVAGMMNDGHHLNGLYRTTAIFNEKDIGSFMCGSGEYCTKDFALSVNSHQALYLGNAMDLGFQAGDTGKVAQAIYLHLKAILDGITDTRHRNDVQQRIAGALVSLDAVSVEEPELQSFLLADIPLNRSTT